MNKLELSERDKDALSIIISMAQIYLWELFDKKEGCIYWNQHRENMDRIFVHHEKFNQGIMATGIDILSRISELKGE